MPSSIKLSSEILAQIKAMHDSGISEIEIGKNFGLSYRCIQKHTRPDVYNAWKKKVVEANKRLRHRKKKETKNETNSIKKNIRDLNKQTRDAKLRSEPFPHINRAIRWVEF